MRKKRGKEIFRIETHKAIGAIIFLIILISLFSIGSIPMILYYIEFGFQFSFVTLILIFMWIMTIIFLLLLCSYFVTYLIIYEKGVFIRKSNLLLYFLYKKYIPFDDIDDVRLNKERRSSYRHSWETWVLYIYTKDQKIYDTDYILSLRKKTKLEKAVKLILKNKKP